MKSPVYEYAVYKGEDLLSIGTMKECAKELGLSPRTLYFYTTPAYQKRRKNDNWMTVVKVGRLDEE